ncbi:MAG: CPBP family intramembrane metalloprotease [Spirochaetales bacterium]|nr:CPBP family intramembrane metalloprotease [Spirochaetales bacterium]
MKNKLYIKKFEPLLLFGVIFFPGYLSQLVMESDPEMFNNAIMLFFYFITAVSQIFLIWYLIHMDNRIPPEVYGIVPIRKRTVLLSFPALVGVFITLIPVYVLSAIILVFTGYPEVEGIVWQFSNFPLLPIVLISCLTTGYLEELYFRSYLTTKMTFAGYSRNRIIILANLIFAVGHLYQGIAGLAGTFVIGIYLTFLFFIRRDIHLIAITHGLYNFTILVLSSFIPQ